MTVIIFSTDKQDPHSLALFKSFFIGHSKRNGNLIPLIGKYRDMDAEFSFLCREDDFYNIVQAHNFVNEQESVLAVTECNKQYATLRYRWYDHQTCRWSFRIAVNSVEGIGSLKSVDRNTALSDKTGWTYKPSTNEWYVTVGGNPDNSPPSEGWNADYIRVPKEEEELYEEFKQTKRISIGIGLARYQDTCKRVSVTESSGLVPLFLGTLRTITCYQENKHERSDKLF